MAKIEREVKREIAGELGELTVFRFAGGKFGIDLLDTIYQDFGPLRGGWIECPNDRVREFAVARGML